MHLVLAGIGAVVVGAGDFSGGTATRRDLPHPVAALSFLVGAIGLLALTPLFGGSPTVADMTWGAISGLGGMVGVFTLYRGFASAPMGLVSPVAALVAAMVPVAGGLVLGEALGKWGAIGLAVGLIAVVLVSVTPAVGLTRQARLLGVGHGLITGVGFGIQLLALALVGDDAGLLPVVASRAVGFGLLGGYLVLNRRRFFPLQAARPATITAGLLTALGNLLYYLAVGLGPIAITTAVYALFPVSTVVMARLVHHERLSARQMVGVGLAVVAASILAGASVS